MLRLLLVLLLVLPGSVFAELDISNAWIKNLPPTVPVRAGYMTLHNAQVDAVSIIAIRSDAFASINIHQTIDQDGVGQLMKMAIDNGRKARPDLEVGICGEHGGEASSVKFCHRIGLDYVSCSPFRVPIARLAAAQAAVKAKAEG